MHLINSKNGERILKRTIQKGGRWCLVCSVGQMWTTQLHSTDATLRSARASLVFYFFLTFLGRWQGFWLNKTFVTAVCSLHDGRSNQKISPSYDVCKLGSIPTQLKPSKADTAQSSMGDIGNERLHNVRMGGLNGGHNAIGKNVR
jgi:hypothetical protein